MIHKIIVLLFCFCLASGMNAQGIVKKAELIGSWKVVKVEMPGIVVAEGESLIFTESYFSDLSESMTKNFKKSFGLITQGSLNAKHTFAKDGTFTQTSKDGQVSKGKYTLKGSKLSFHYSNGDNKEFSISIQNNQLIFSYQERDTQMIFTNNKI